MDFEKLTNGYSTGLMRYRWWILLCVLLVTAGLAYASQYLKVNNDYDTWLPSDERVSEMYRIVDKEFSANALVFVVLDFSENGVFHPDSLALVQKMTRELEGIRELFNVTSLTNIVDIRKTDAGIEVRDLIPEIPRSESELQALKEYVLSKEMYVNSVISPDAAYTVLLANIEGKYEEVVVAGVVLRKVEETAGGHPYYIGGDPALVHYLDQYTKEDMELLVPLTLFVMVVILAYGLKTFWGVVLPLSFVGLCIVWTFGLQAIFKLDANVMSPSVVVLLIAMGSDYAVHIYNHFRKTGDIEKATSEISIPVVMSAATTVAGLLTFTTTRIDILQYFGFELAFGLGSACFLSIVLLPICVRLVRAKPAPADKMTSHKEDRLTNLLDRLGKWAHHHTRFILVTTCICMAVMALGIPRIVTNVDFVDLLPEDSPPRQGNDILRDHFSGIYPVCMYFNGDIEDPSVMERKNYVENFMRSDDLLSSFTSINGLISEENWLLNGVYAVPETREGIANLWLLLEGEEILRTFVTPDRTQSLITGMIREPQTDVMWHISQLLRDFLSENVADQVVVIDPGRLLPEARLALHELQLREAARQLAWLAQGYDKPARHDFAPILLKLRQEIPRLDEGLDLNPVWAAARAYLEQETVEEIPVVQIAQILTHLQARWTERANPEFMDRIAGILTASQGMASEDAQTTAQGVLRRAESVLRIERASALRIALDDLFPPGLAEDKDFRKRAEGVLWSLWTSQPVFFSKQAQAIPGIEQAVVARKQVEIEQAGMPDFMRRFDELLYASQIQSLVLAAIAVLVLISVTQRSFRRGMASLLSVLAPLVVVLGLMGWTGIPLDYSTVLCGALIIGLGVDGSIHFLTYHHRLQLKGATGEPALRETARHIGRAVVTANATTCFGFSVLILSKTSTMKYFALLNSTAILLVTLSVLTVLPALVALFHINHEPEQGTGGSQET